jgi:prophage maintenance system killer protein
VIFTSERDNLPARPDRAAGYVQLARGLYSDDTRSAPEEIARREWLSILGAVMPGAVITGRSAFAMRPVDGYLFVSHPRTRAFSIRGLKIIPTRGLPAQPDDTQLGDGVYVASEARALVDNAVPSRAVNGQPSRTLTRDELHDEVVRLVRSRTAERTAALLEATRAAAAKNGRPESADDIAVFFRSAQGRQPTVKTGSRTMRAAQANRGFDTRRVASFERLADTLSGHRPKVLFQRAGQTYQPFFEAYFSNFIEGTEFTVGEAAEIALKGKIEARRPADSHDISGTYRIVNDDTEMSSPLATYAEFEESLRRRHAAIMEGRPEIGPGIFKDQNNRAGITEFVGHELVEGTLREGWERLGQISDAFARATYVMFMVSEVHPFTDGNGRVSRIMMNGELAQAGYAKIIVPTALRDDYISGLIGLSSNDRADGLVSVLEFAQRYTSQVDFADLETATRVLTATNAFLEPGQADRLGKPMILPRDLLRGWEYREAPTDPNRNEQTVQGAILDAAAAARIPAPQGDRGD